MARLNCPGCTTWLVDVSDAGWRVTSKNESCDVLDPCLDSPAVESDDLWADLELVNARTDEWRDRGVYDPLPPPPDPPNSAVLVRCACGIETLFPRRA